MPIRLTVCAATDVGLVRKTNEDAFVIADLTADKPIGAAFTRVAVGERGVLLAVSDGMGGHNAGEVASRIVVDSLRRTMASSPAPIEALVETAVKAANTEVWQASHLPGQERMGATLTALLLRGGTAHIAEVGDSRAYLLRGGSLVQVTHDQSYVQTLVDSGAIKPEEADSQPLKNLILQAMGQQPDVMVALGRLELRQRDCFILCSDGLTNLVTPDEMRETILAAPRLDAACSKLIALANEHGGHDNITVILGGVSGDLPPLVAGEPISETFQVLQEFDAAVVR